MEKKEGKTSREFVAVVCHLRRSIYHVSTLGFMAAIVLTENTQWKVHSVVKMSS